MRPNLSASDSFDRHTKVIGDTRSLMADVADCVAADSRSEPRHLLPDELPRADGAGAERSARAGPRPRHRRGGQQERHARHSSTRSIGWACWRRSFRRGLDQSLGRMLTFNEPLRLELEPEVRRSSAAVRECDRVHHEDGHRKGRRERQDYSADLNRSVSAILRPAEPCRWVVATCCSMRAWHGWSASCSRPSRERRSACCWCPSSALLHHARHQL